MNILATIRWMFASQELPGLAKYHRQRLQSVSIDVMTVIDPRVRASLVFRDQGIKVKEVEPRKQLYK